jgi:hypothetical protein
MQARFCRRLLHQPILQAYQTAHQLLINCSLHITACFPVDGCWVPKVCESPNFANATCSVNDWMCLPINSLTRFKTAVDVPPKNEFALHATQNVPRWVQRRVRNCKDNNLACHSPTTNEWISSETRHFGSVAALSKSLSSCYQDFFPSCYPGNPLGFRQSLNHVDQRSL